MAALVRSLAKHIPLISFNLRSILISLFVLIIIAALFFIPDIAQYQTANSNSVEEAALTETESVPDAAADGEQATVVTNSTTDANEQIDGAVIDGQETVTQVHRRESPLDQVYSLFDRSPGTEAGGEVANAPSEAEVQERSNVGKLLDKDPVTWDALRSSQVRAVLNRAKNDVSALLRGIPERYSSTKFALYNYLNGIDLIMGGSDQLTAEEAIRYLEHLDQSVTRNMIEEGVDRSDYMRWSSVSLSNVLQQSKASRMKERYRMVFDPKMTLSWVSVSGPSAYELRTDPEAYKTGSFLRLKAYLQGKEIKRVSLYRDGNFVGEVGITPPSKDGKRFVFYETSPASGYWTFKVEDEYGETYEKTYVFYPKVQAYSSLTDTTYKIPFGGNFNGPPNKRLDRYFTKMVKLGVKDVAQSNGMFSTF